LNEILETNQVKKQAKTDSSWMASWRRIFSPAFGRPFMGVGVIFLLNQWGEFTNLVMNMISIFRESKSSIDPELAPVFVGIIQVCK
jgi:hypothetical protein